MEIAIVTGASSGLGREYAKLLDQEGLDEIWLVARRRPQLETLAGELTTKSRIYDLDLTDRASFLTLQQALAACQVTVRYLIHAAGFGKMGPLQKYGLAGPGFSGAIHRIRKPGTRGGRQLRGIWRMPESLLPISQP